MSPLVKARRSGEPRCTWSPFVHLYGSSLLSCHSDAVSRITHFCIFRCEATKTWRLFEPQTMTLRHVCHRDILRLNTVRFPFLWPRFTKLCAAVTISLHRKPSHWV